MLENKLAEIFSLIEKGNDKGEPITLVGATKMVDVDTINKAINLGLKVVAENKVQEFNLKHGKIVGATEHFIGHLQTNKVKYLVGNVSLIHSVDSIHLAQEIDKQAYKKGIKQDILLEVNVGGELSKSGFVIDNALESATQIKDQFKNVHIKGLMAMLPHSLDQDFLASLFDKMRALYEQLKYMGFDCVHLSMGMSNDYKLAIKHGSNMIRLGTEIFGKRIY